MCTGSCAGRTVYVIIDYDGDGDTGCLQRSPNVAEQDVRAQQG